MGPGTLTAQSPKSLKGVVPCVEGRCGAGVRPAVAWLSRCRQMLQAGLEPGMQGSLGLHLLLMRGAPRS